MVLGTGSSWPQDFLFFAGFFSSSLSTGSGESREVSAGETVNWISGEGEAERDSIGLMVSVMLCVGWPVPSGDDWGGC